MIRLPKSVISFGTLALAAGVLTLAVPRAAHAVAAALVQVTNTPANPAVTQDTSKRAGQLVQLFCEASVGNFSSCGVFTNLVTPLTQYTVPAGQNLVITSVDLYGYAGGTGDSEVELRDTVQQVRYHLWLISGWNSLQFQYPSGIVLPSGTMPSIAASRGAVVHMNGYLTNN